MIFAGSFGAKHFYHGEKDYEYVIPKGQRQKNLGSRVALLPGKFLRVRKVFARITEKKPFKLSQYFQTIRIFPDDANFLDAFKTVRIFPDDCQFSG